jgi:hypothetical protein
MNLGTVINFCSNDYPFLRACIDSIKPIASQIVVPVCDHFFDGVPEDRQTLQRIYAENPDVQFIEFPYTGSYPSVYWHNLARMIATYFLNSEYVLFLDCDEIAGADRIPDCAGYDAVRFYNYWYFREPRFQATVWEDSPLLVKKEKLTGEILMNPRERHGIFDAIAGPKTHRMAGSDGKPMFHHYSWVRTKEQLLRKVSSWSHCSDRDWAPQVEEEFSRGFNGTDFVHGYQFIEVPPYVSIDLQKKPEPFSSCDFSHVRKLSIEEVNEIDLAMTFQIPLSLS